MNQSIVRRFTCLALACIITAGAALPTAYVHPVRAAESVTMAARNSLSATELITGSDCTYKSGAVNNSETAASAVVDDQQLGGEQQLHSTKDGGIAGFANVDFGSGVDQITVYYAGYTSNFTVQLILDDPANGVYAEITPTKSTGGWTNYTSATFTIPKISGVHTLYLRFSYPSNPSSFLANIPGFQFANTNTAKPVTGVTLEQTSADLSVGQTLQMKPTVEPADATYTGLHYTTNNADVATVDAGGKITAVGAGEATITATSVHSGQSASCTVNVTRPAVSGVTLSETAVTMGLHGEHQLIATVQPDAALNKNVTFASSDDKIVTVTDNGLLKAVGIGNATITVTTEENNCTAECSVTVEAETLVESLTLSKNTVDLDKGTMAEVKVTIAPADATVQTYTVVSGDESIAKVDAAGRVIAVGEGTTTITYTSNSTSAESATLTVKVTAPVDTGTVEYSNPIVGGYAPDPSICRGTDGYYLINSSFTSFPGIPVYYSQNMVDWELVSYAASSDEIQFGDNYTNGGLWAPTIRYIESKGAYYMIVKNMSDSKTIITHTTDPKTVAWSDPIYVSDSTGKVLTNVGIDPDLFEDADGTVYYTEGNEQIAKIDLDTGRIEKLYYNWSGLVDMYTEGPHIYRVGDYYYCTVAEGGTGADHMTTIARKPVSEGLINTANNREDAQEGWEIAPVYTGYDVIQRYLKQNSQNGRSVLKQQVDAGNVADSTAEPHNPILHNPSGLDIDTCGHSDFVEDENGNWWIVFLGRRDNTGPDLARETFLAPVEWIDGWPVVNGGELITADMAGPAIETDWQPNEKPVYFGFDTEELNLHFNFIRNIGENDYSLTANPGYLTLYAIADSIDGKNAASGNNNGQQPSWVGLRQTEKNAVVTTAVDFQPSNNTDAAGLTMYNTSDNQSGPYNLEFVVMKDGDGRKLVVDTGRNVVKKEVGIPADGTVYLRMSVVSRTGGADVTMAYSMDNQQWTDVITLDVADSINRIQYTGIYFGMYASGRGTDTRTPAKFDFFTYESSEVGKKEIALSDTTTERTMEVGDTQTIQPTVTAADLVNQKLMYAVTAGQDVISVDQNGAVTALQAGEATLKVVSEYDQSKSVAYTVTVTGDEGQQPGEDPVVEGLYYDGVATFDEATGTLTFQTSGLIQNPELKAEYAQYETDAELPLDAWYNVFTVPASVKKIVIGEDVTVTGRFDIAHDCTIEGVDRDTSVIYGTEQTRYSHNRGDEYGAEWDKPWEYSSIDVIGAATVYVKNLTVQDPYGYCISGYAKDAVIHCEAVSMIDTREGQQNNSDGFVGQAGSSLTDVYIETADDAVKAYHDLTMTDVEIVMLKNGAPIQFGWNADDDEDTDVVIEGLTITTREGIDSYNRGVFSWVSKDNTKTITVTANNVNINVPNANLFEMNPTTGTANITMTNATVVTKGEGTNNTMGTVAITAPATTHTVTFNTNGGSEIAAVEVEDGKPVAKPADPTKSGYTFAGWYTDEALSDAYDFASDVTADITLYAKWTEHTSSDQKIEAEDYAAAQGVNKVDINTIDSQKVTNFQDGDYVAYQSVDLTGIKQIGINLSSGALCGDESYDPEEGDPINGYAICQLEARVGGVDGQLLGTLDVFSTRGPDSFRTDALQVTNAYDGVADLYLVCKKVHDRPQTQSLVNLNYMILTSREDAIEPDTTQEKLDKIAAHDEYVHIINDYMRDPYITWVEKDQCYYMSTTFYYDPYYAGITAGLYKSTDLVNWEYLGPRYTLLQESNFDGYMDKTDPTNANLYNNLKLWEPEIYWFDDLQKWGITHTTNQRFANVAIIEAGKFFGDGAIEYDWGYELDSDNNPYNTAYHDPSIFTDNVDSDGDGLYDKYLMYTMKEIRRIADDCSGWYAEDKNDPDGHAHTIKPSDQVIGHEGITMLKIGDKYVFLGTGWSTGNMQEGTYNLYYCVGDSPYGPFSERRLLGRSLGHSTVFQDKDGNWWCTTFQNGTYFDPTWAYENDLPQDETGAYAHATLNEEGLGLVPLTVTVTEDDVFIVPDDIRYATPGSDEKGGIPQYGNWEGEQLTLQAEDSVLRSGTVKEQNITGGKVLASIKNGTYFAFKNVQMEGVNGISIRYSNAGKSGVSLELRSNAIDGPVIQEISLPSTGTWNDYKTVYVDLEQAVTENTTLYFVAKSADTESYLMNVDVVNLFRSSGFVAVTSIAGVPTSMDVGEQVTLHGDLSPANATNREVVWTLKDAGTTGAVLDGNVLTAAKPGTLILTATVANGVAQGQNYTQEFSIHVLPELTETKKIEGEAYTDNGGSVKITNYASASGKKYVGDLHNGEWLQYENVDLTNLVQIGVQLSTPSNTATIEVRKDGPDGEILCEIETAKTANWNDYQKFYATVNDPSLSGTATICLVFVNPNVAGYLGNLDYIELGYGEPAPVVETHDVTYTLTNVTAAGQPAAVEEGKTLTATLTAATGYELPDTITVTMDGAAADFTYDKVSGIVTVANVTGPVVITAVGVQVEEPVTTHTVTFETNGGSEITAVEVEDGKPVAKPADPTKSGYTFAGWYTNEELTTAYDFNEEVTADITLYAKWTKNSSSSSSSSSGNKTETTTNPDGSTTTTVTKPDGSKTETTKAPDGSSSVVSTTKDGQVSAKVTVTSSAVENAEGPVALPMPAVTANDDLDKAAEITVDLPANATVQVEIPVEDATAGTVAVIVKADGTEEVIKTSFATEDGVVVELSDGDTVKIVDNSKDFADVPASFWGADAVAFATSHELFNGTSEDTFSPNADMNRAMIVTVLARLEGVDTTTGDTWYEAGQQWAMENGISDGTNMMGSLTREQLAAMLYRYVGEPAVSGAITGFDDTASVSSWASDAMTWAVQNGIISGSGSKLNPQGEATRAEVATMLMRFIAL